MMTVLKNKLYELTENSDGTASWGVDSGMNIIDMMVFDEEGKYAGALDIDDPMWDQLVSQITLDEAIQFIEKAGDDLENIDSIQLPRVYQNDGPLGYTGDQVGGYFVRWTSGEKDTNPYYVAEGDEDS
jgi:beta-glucosidase